MKYPALVLTALLLLGCNTGNFKPTSQNDSSALASATKKTVPQITGGWEVIATSNQTTNTINETRVETRFSQATNGRLTGSPIRVFGIVYPGFYNVELATFRVGGLCSYAAGLGYPPTLTGRVQTTNTHRASRVMLKLIEAPGVQFNFNGVLQTDGSITGTYTGGGTYCPDSGSFVAKPAVSMAGTYIMANAGCITCVSSTVSENTTITPPTISMEVTATTLLGGLPFPTCTTTFSGTVVGNAIQVTGIPPNPEPAECGTLPEVTYQGIYFHNVSLLGSMFPVALVLYDSNGFPAWMFLRI
jgi:hypothetical protein